MKSLSAILAKSGSDLIVDWLELPSTLEVGQVLVRVITSGICGAQINEIDAVKGPDKFLPHLLGHEGYCEVVRTGPEVSKISQGDHAVMHWRPSEGVQSPVPKYNWNGLLVNAGWVTTFNQYSVVSENRLTRVKPYALSRDLLPLLGCALTTSYGVVHRELKLSANDSVLIFGAGGVGLSMIKVLKSAGVSKLCAVDTNSEKLDLAKKFGATDIVQFGSKQQVFMDVKNCFLAETPIIGIDTTGNTDCIELSYELTDSQGTVMLVGVPKKGEKSSFYTLPLHFGKRIIGSSGGGSIPTIDIPILITKIKSAELNFSDFPIQRYSLRQINEAITDLRKGKAGRMIIDMELD
jgi:Zn-dependent alcohol dehydrogenase